MQNLRENTDVLGLSIWSEGVECLNYLHLDTSHFQRYIKIHIRTLGILKRKKAFSWSPLGTWCHFEHLDPQALLWNLQFAVSLRDLGKVENELNLEQLNIPVYVWSIVQNAEVKWFFYQFLACQGINMVTWTCRNWTGKRGTPMDLGDTLSWFEVKQAQLLKSKKLRQVLTAGSQSSVPCALLAKFGAHPFGTCWDPAAFQGGAADWWDRMANTL